MQWHDLLFAHWPMAPERLAPLLPPGLTLDTFDGVAWIGVVPFLMAGVRPHYVAAMPWISAFAELNVRTYATAGGKPGVWFFSLDAANPLAVFGARNVFHLPYFNARMICTAAGQGIHYTSTRTHAGARPAIFSARYVPSGPVYRATAGTLEHWLTERYCLYAANRRGSLWRGEIHHEPWSLQPAEAQFERLAMTEQIGLALPDVPPVLHFARRLDVVAWSNVPVWPGA